MPVRPLFEALKNFKRSGTLPLEKKMAYQVQYRVHTFELDKNDNLYHLDLQSGTRAPYIEPSFRWDLLKYAYNNYNYFGPLGI